LMHGNMNINLVNKHRNNV